MKAYYITMIIFTLILRHKINAQTNTDSIRFEQTISDVVITGKKYCDNKRQTNEIEGICRN